MARRTIDDREIELFVGRVEICKEVKHRVDHFDVALFRLVDLVDADDRAKADFQRFRHHEFCLRHRAFCGVDQHDGAVDHVQDAFDFAAEVGVSGRVDDVDADVVPDDRSGLRQDGDAALTLQIVGIHHSFGRGFVLAERARLFEQAVDQRGLAVVDVGDDGDVAQLHDGFFAGGGLNCAPQYPCFVNKAST